jgi:hypothetical protein
MAIRPPTLKNLGVANYSTAERVLKALLMTSPSPHVSFH